MNSTCKLTTNQNKEKEIKKTIRTLRTLRTLRKMNTQFNANVYCFTEELFKDLLNNFDGKVVGEDGMKMEDVMKHFFGGFVPDKENLVEPEVELAPPKKGKAKKEKDPTRPKRATTAFFFYVATIRDEVKEANPGKQVGELSKIYSKMWSDIKDTEDCKPFLEKAEEDKARYAKEMEEWNAKENAQ